MAYVFIFILRTRFPAQKSIASKENQMQVLIQKEKEHQSDLAKPVLKEENRSANQMTLFQKEKEHQVDLVKSAQQGKIVRQTKVRPEMSEIMTFLEIASAEEIAKIPLLASAM